MPQVTVLLPAYNASQYIAECIESLLSQTFTDFELLIINDGSTDDTVAICERYADPRIRLVHNLGNRGVTYTLNRGVELAIAPLIARMDADDVAMKNRLEVQVRYLENHPEVAAVSSEMIQITQEGKVGRRVIPTPNDSDYICWALMFRNPIMHPTVMFRTSLIRAMNGYGTEETYVEDYDLWSRLHRIYPIHVLPERLITYRIHEESVCNQNNSRQAIAAARIARDNMEFLLGIPVNEVDARLLFYAYHGHKNSYGVVQIRQAIHLLGRLYERFTETRRPHASALKHIRRDTRRMIVNLLLSLPLAERLQILVASPFPQQLGDPVLALNVMHDWKQSAKRILRRESSFPIAPPPEQLPEPHELHHSNPIPSYSP
jgi:glycosyltransferase involved in cell wall biosynthesis